MRNRILRSAGFLLYLAAFWLPSIGNPEYPLKDLLMGGYAIPGYFCAFISLFWGVGGVLTSSGFADSGHHFALSLLLPGLANLLLLTYLVLSLRRRAPRTCRALAVFIMFSSISAAVCFAFIPFIPLEGFFSWVAGITILIWSDFWKTACDITRGVRAWNESSNPESHESQPIL